MKSSYSASSSNCVETRLSERVELRDTQNRDAATLSFPAVEWTALLTSETTA
ncbi:DUF397 domain-containing protein [Nocardiopsis synnemataformans]|uniref:DUF397 domain-containing protein n=1 Tax=Nocardiopsis synnemataformans TaxID=61305 RepID=UPI003EB7F01B